MSVRIVSGGEFCLCGLCLGVNFVCVSVECVWGEFCLGVSLWIVSGGGELGH